MLNLTPNQWIAIALALLGVIAGSTAQMSDLFGAHIAHIVVTVASFGQSIIAAILVALTGQGAQVRSVLAMPGIDGIKVNAAANQTLAAIAIDPAQDKIEPAIGAEAKLSQTAKGV